MTWTKPELATPAFTRLNENDVDLVNGGGLSICRGESGVGGGGVLTGLTFNPFLKFDKFEM